MFNLLDSPCLAAIATMAKANAMTENGSGSQFSSRIYLLTLFASAVYQIGSFVTGGAFGIGTVVGFAVPYRNALPAVQTRSVQRSESLFQTFCTGIKNYEIIKRLDTEMCPASAFNL